MRLPKRSRSLGTFAICLAALIGLPAALGAASGVDAYGYTWIDSDEPGGPVRQNINYDNLVGGNPFPEGQDSPGGADYMRDLNLPFPFPYYGQQFTQVRATGNGFLTFDLFAVQEPTNKPIPLNQTPDNVLAFLWDDLSTNSVDWGSVGNGTGFKIHMWGYIQMGANQEVYNLEIILWSDGRIRYQYTAGQDNGSITVGIESPGGVYGVQNLYNGTPIQDPGRPSLIQPNFVIEYTPPQVPNCSDAEAITCGTTPSASPSAMPIPDAKFYGCGTDALLGWEKVFTFTLTETSHVSATLTNLGGRDLRLFLLRRCDSALCIAGDSADVDFGILGPGDYYLVVDGSTEADNGQFTLTMNCDQLSQPISCGDRLMDDTNGGTTSVNNYPCAPGGSNHSGHEMFYDVTLPAPGHLFATVTGNPNLDVFLFPPGTANPADCLAWGDQTAALFNVPAGQYIVVVDGPPGSEGLFDLEVECGRQMDCSSPQPGQLQCGSSVQNAAIMAGPSSAVKYSCDEDAWLGPEHVYDLWIGAPTTLVVSFQTSDNLGMFLLNSCNEGDCMGGNDVAACVENMAAGNFTLVVDSATGLGGDYDMDVTCIPPNLFQRWSACENPRAGTTLGDTVSDRWQFDDQYYCVDDARHRNNDGTGFNGCAFAMYAVVECGQEMHLPLWDVEAGRLRIFDLLRNEYVTLYGETPTWSQVGTELEWADSGCGDADPNNDGFDPRFNEQVNDIHFYGGPNQTEPVCGVFRMEFFEWGGFVWDLFSNCSGGDYNPAREIHFDIYDNICDALDAYDPKPELSIVNPTDNGLCPDVTIDFDVANTGCKNAMDFVINLFEETPTGDVLVETIPVSEVEAGETVHYQTTVSLQSGSRDVRLEVDGNNDIRECSEAEAVGEATACRPQQGLHTFSFGVCECSPRPTASANPTRVCRGGTSRLSGAGSSIPTCASGVLEYNWTTTPAQPGPADLGWSTMQTRDVGPIDVDTTWYLWVRCQENPACINTDGAPVTVTSHRPPDMGTVTVDDPDVCQPALQLNWTDAVFYHDPVNGPGVYNIYRIISTGNLAQDCANAVALPPIVTGLTGLAFLDVTTSPNETYVYVVEAEDADPLNPCSPPGPVRAGAVGRTCIQGPIWDETDRTPPGTDVGNTLMAFDGDQDSVSFAWVDPRAPGETRERFRVFRSEASTGPFDIIGDMIDIDSFTDPNAPAILYFYDVRTVDTCSNVAVDPFPPDKEPPPSCANLDLACGSVLEASTGTCLSDIDSHPCFARDATGPDRLHSLRLTSMLAEVRLRLTSQADLDLYVYDASLAACLDWGDQEVTLFNADAGRYWVIVDGAAGEQGNYTLDVICP